MTISRSRKGHTHPCALCGKPTECHGDWERNYDGFPEAICTDYHLPSGSIAEVLCESCRDDRERRIAWAELEAE